MTGLTLHFTPTSGSWLNLVEAFGIITRQAIRRGSFDSVKELVTAIRTFIEGWNDLPPVHLDQDSRPDPAARHPKTRFRRATLAEFDDLLGTTLQSIELSGDTRARLLLAGDETLSDRIQRLADAECSCCSSFTFGVSTAEDGLVALDIAVPAAYADVLAGLAARAHAALAAAS